MGKTITISPVSRIEGHAAISIQLDDSGQVADACLQVREFRGFETFCVGRPLWEMPAITARICGICPVSHSLAASMAAEQILGIEPPPAATLLRTILSLAQLLLSHSLSFFHLSAPDIVLGLDCDPAERNIVGLTRHKPDLIRKGIRLRQIAQEIVNRVGGGMLHPEHVCPGGIRQPLTPEDRDIIVGLLPEAGTLVTNAFSVWQRHCRRFLSEMGEWAEPDTLALGLTDDQGYLNHLDGNLRLVRNGKTVIMECPADRYAEVIGESVTNGSYMKPTDLLLAGSPPYRVGPLARLQAAPFRGSPRAEQKRLSFLADPLSHTPLGSHVARLIEMSHAVERLTGLLNDPLVCAPHVLNQGKIVADEGVGVTEAPRGTLIHHYRVDRHGLLEKVHLIVATGHNTRAMDRTITAIARRHLSGDTLNEGLLNRVEHGIRLYDPCLSCATHLHGRLGIGVSLRAPDGALLDQATI